MVGAGYRAGLSGIGDRSVIGDRTQRSPEQGTHRGGRRDRPHEEADLHPRHDVGTQCHAECQRHHTGEPPHHAAIRQLQRNERRAQGGGDQVAARGGAEEREVARLHREVGTPADPHHGRSQGGRADGSDHDEHEQRADQRRGLGGERAPVTAACVVRQSRHEHGLRGLEQEHRDPGHDETRHERAGHRGLRRRQHPDEHRTEVHERLREHRRAQQPPERTGQLAPRRLRSGLLHHVPVRTDEGGGHADERRDCEHDGVRTGGLHAGEREPRDPDDAGRGLHAEQPPVRVEPRLAGEHPADEELEHGADEHHGQGPDEHPVPREELAGEDRTGEQDGAGHEAREGAGCDPGAPDDGADTEPTGTTARDRTRDLLLDRGAHRIAEEKPDHPQRREPGRGLGAEGPTRDGQIEVGEHPADADPDADGQRPPRQDRTGAPRPARRGAGAIAWSRQGDRTHSGPSSDRTGRIECARGLGRRLWSPSGPPSRRLHTGREHAGRPPGLPHEVSESDPVPSPTPWRTSSTRCATAS